MLVMRRRAGESFLIGPEIEIEVLEVGPTRVKLGIVAPAQLAIARKEVVLTRAENLTASQATDPQVIAWLTRKLGLRQRMDTVNSLTFPDNQEKSPNNSAQKY
jgi:carbon storage regulator CsrA